MTYDTGLGCILGLQQCLLNAPSANIAAFPRLEKTRLTGEPKSDATFARPDSGEGEGRFLQVEGDN